MFLFHVKKKLLESQSELHSNGRKAFAPRSPKTRRKRLLRGQRPRHSSVQWSSGESYRIPLLSIDLARRTTATNRHIPQMAEGEQVPAVSVQPEASKRLHKPDRGRRAQRHTRHWADSGV